MSGEATDTASRDRPEPAAAAAAPEQASAVRQRKKEEFRTWFFLTFVMAPVLAVAVVSAYGFAVWFYQLFVGPPGS